MTKVYNLSELSASAVAYVFHASDFLVKNGYINYTFECYLRNGLVLWQNPLTYERVATLVLSNGQVLAFKESL